MIRNDIAIFYSNVFLGFKVYCNQVVLKERKKKKSWRSLGKKGPYCRKFGFYVRVIIRLITHPYITDECSRGPG